MAIIKPFKGIRPPKELVEQVASRPYDVLNSEEAREEAKGNEKSLYHIINRKLISLPEQTNTILKYMRRLPKISRCFRTRAGWCKMKKKIIMYMHKP